MSFLFLRDPLCRRAAVVQKKKWQTDDADATYANKIVFLKTKFSPTSFGIYTSSTYLLCFAIQLVKQQFKRTIGLRSKRYLRSKSIQHPFTNRRCKCSHPVS